MMIIFSDVIVSYNHEALLSVAKLIIIVLSLRIKFPFNFISGCRRYLFWINPSLTGQALFQQCDCFGQSLSAASLNIVFLYV
jgi:hypothetical protein